MPSATCHCGAVSVDVPRKPRTVTSCNCSICRRYGVLWAYYRDDEVTLRAAPGATDDYVWGDRTQAFIRCKTCGCVMQWRKFERSEGTRSGVNARNFAPAVLDGIRIRRLDGANTWKIIG